MLIEHVLPACNMNLVLLASISTKTWTDGRGSLEFPRVLWTSRWKTTFKRSGNTGSSFITAEERTVLHYLPLQGRAMARVVSRRPLTAEARLRARVNPCGICGAQSGTGTGFSPSSSFFPSIYHSTVALQTNIIWGMRNMLTWVGIHAWVPDQPHLQEKMRRQLPYKRRCWRITGFACVLSLRRKARQLFSALRSSVAYEWPRGSRDGD
jgi:hypothetical protein